MATEAQVFEWIEKSLVSENLKDLKISKAGSTEKDDGYWGDIVFIIAEGTTESGHLETMDLVVKHGKNNENLRRLMPIKKAFFTEIYIYKSVVPAFQELQSKYIVSSFDAIPKCYFTTILDDMEGLVLKNLTTIGYEHHDKLIPMNFNHCKAVLIEYGKWHAMSFALKQHDEEKFEILRRDVLSANTYLRLLEVVGFRKTIDNIRDTILDKLKETGQRQLYEKFGDALKGGPGQMLMDLYKEEEEQDVITHGDCWSNNLMFKYENTDKSNPSKVAIIDFQLSSVVSPVFDISFFLYASGSQEALDHSEDLFQAYYDSLASYATELNCNVEKMFSRSDLKRHWNKYSVVGLIIVMTSFKIIYVEKEKIPSINNVREGYNFDAMLDEMPCSEKFYERFLPVLSHYLESTK